MTINYKKTAWNDNASGYTPITPTRLNNIENALKSVCDGWDSVSQPPSFACAMHNCTSSGALRGYKVGRLVTLYMTGIPALSADLAAWNGRQVATVPAGYRPAAEAWLPASFDRAAGYVTIATNGAVTIHARESSLPKGHGFAVGGSYVC